MKGKDLQKKTPADLQKLLGEDQVKLQQLRFDLPSGKIKNVRQIRALRREIARIMTILHRQ